MSFSCALVAIAAAFGKGDQLIAVFVFFGLGGFILLRYLGYFRFEFFGEGLSTLIEDRKSTKSIEQTIKEAELLVADVVDLSGFEVCLRKVAECMQFQEATITFYGEKGRLGSSNNRKGASNGIVCKTVSWSDGSKKGYFSRDKEFTAEFTLSGRNYDYGKIKYVFVDGRSELSVQDEVLLERVHDSFAAQAAKLRKSRFP